MHSVRNQLQMSHLWRENSNVFQITKLACNVMKWEFWVIFKHCAECCFLQYNASKAKRCAREQYSAAAIKNRASHLPFCKNEKVFKMSPIFFTDGRSMRLRILSIRSLNLRMYLGFLLVMLWGPLVSLSNAQQFDTASVNTELASASAAVIQGN